MWFVNTFHKIAAIVEPARFETLASKAIRRASIKVEVDYLLFRSIFDLHVHPLTKPIAKPRLQFFITGVFKDIAK